MRTTTIVLAACTALLIACGDSGTPAHQDPTQDVTVNESRPPLSEALDGVNMVYESVGPDDEPCLKIGVIELTDALREALPRTVEGWPVVVVEAGEIRPLD